jgi:hypothetical protein
VHSWGGFGSQLFTAYVILKIQTRYPGRRVKAIIHTSGVTRRATEFRFDKLGVTAKQIEDYKSEEVKSKANRNHHNSLAAFKKYLINILQCLRFIQNANTDSSFNSTRFWTISFRGHYTRLTLDESTVRLLYYVLFPVKSEMLKRNDNFVIHYRLGDLLDLSGKTPVSIERIESICNESITHLVTPILMSDSNKEELTNFLARSNFLKSFELLNANPIATLETCVMAHSFLGTGAKISLWAAIFRYFLFGKESFLPEELIWAQQNGVKAVWY